jgi:hypothetical protein
MPTEPRRGGAAVAPDATEQERSTVLRPAAELTPDQQREASQARVDRIASLNSDLANGPEPPTMEEAAARARERAPEPAVNASEVKAALDPPMDSEEAADALTMMLSVDADPEPEIDFIRIDRLSKKFGQDFFFRVRGLTEDEMKEIESAAIRETTAEERERGFARIISDPAKRDRLMVIKGSINPDLTNRQLLQRYKGDSEEALKAWLNPGERIAVAELITELTGFRDGATTRAKAVLEAKKS